MNFDDYISKPSNVLCTATTVIGYKYICWDLGEDNAEIYMDKIRRNEEIHHAELSNCKGFYDQEDKPGIYFCKSLDDLYSWLKELFEFANPSAIELIEVQAVGEVEERQYEDGRIAYVAQSVKGRVLEDRELNASIYKLITDYFN